MFAENISNVHNKYRPDAMIKTEARSIPASKHNREDKDISYAKLTHNVMCDSEWGCPSHMRSGGLGGRGVVPNRGRLGCILRRLELLALIRLILDLRVFWVTQSRARLWGNLITKLTNRWKKYEEREKGKIHTNHTMPKWWLTEAGVMLPN